MITLFNRNPVKVGKSIEEPDQKEIEFTLNLRQASFMDAWRYGGEITRQALSAMNFQGDRKYIVVDTKVHMLLPGFIPAIPGWHTDGVPRGAELDPAGKGCPRMSAQVHGLISAPRYHLLVTGSHCPTRFLNGPWNIDVQDTPDLYKSMSNQVNKYLKTSHVPEDFCFDTPNSTVVEWDWWNIHTAQQAKGRGWRYLIRVTETDHIAPRTNPEDFIRTQTQVYVPTEFGW